MKWFAITNRVKRGQSFKNEPERLGKVHFLSKEAGLPATNRSLSLDYIGHSDQPRAREKFVKEVQADLRVRANKMKRRGLDQKPSLAIYAHGYNNNWKDSLEEYAELRRNFHGELGEKAFEDFCLPVLFSWPSAGKTAAYLEDRDDARASYLAVKNMVHLLYTATNNLQDCISNACVIAHSMGNYVFREALTSLVSAPQSPAGTFIDQMIMLAADVGNTSLEPGGKGFGINRFSNRVTVYFSPADSTLKKSKRKNGRQRLGRTLSGSYLETPDNVVFLDCRNWANKEKLDELFGRKAPSVHSCYRSVPVILEDMFAVLRGVDRDMFPRRDRMDMNKHYELSNNQGAGPQ